jgi:DNA-binding PadR family transcriptional regulator
MEEAGWLKSHWDISANSRRARFYTITGKGRRYLKQLEADWIKHVEAVSRILRTV